MTYSTLLLHLDDEPRVATRVQLALQLARVFESRIVALSATGRLAQPSVALSPYGSGIASAVTADLRAAARERALRFDRAAAAGGQSDAEAIVDDGDEVEALLTHARCSDLVIVGQADPRGAACRAQRRLLERTLLDSAPPCLVVPFAGECSVVGRNILVAWNDSRACSRAILAALPFLQRAALVRLVQCDVPTATGGARSHPRLDAAVRWLSRHGVSVRASVETTEIDFGNALLSRAADFGADLIVAGAWSHSRLGERLFGGVTLTLLDSMTVPVLMTH
jgi:nucleotide-binding universal stress UspA family protein